MTLGKPKTQKVMKFLPKGGVFGLPYTVVALIIGVNVLGGVYIWKPEVIKEAERQKVEKQSSGVELD